MTNRKKISVREQADAIAAAYLQKNARKESYLVQVGPPGMIDVKCQPTDKDVEGINTRRLQSSRQKKKLKSAGELANGQPLH